MRWPKAVLLRRPAPATNVPSLLREKLRSCAEFPQALWRLAIRSGLLKRLTRDEGLASQELEKSLQEAVIDPQVSDDADLSYLLI